MSCCGQKRRAVAQGTRAVTGDTRAHPSSAQGPGPQPPPGRLVRPRPSAAMLAYLARNARSRPR